ncbi:MAG: hypothetical protein KTR31_01010 [Myxococcales bacterium]|nr:hypothetical protein [Myxococcales bacterium]
MSSPTLVPEGHEALKVLRRVPGQRLVLRTRRPSGDCTVLVLLTPVPRHFATTLRGVVLRGRGSIEGLPPEVSRTLEGFRVRARVGLQDGVARVVDAGVLVPEPDAEHPGPKLPQGHGFVWVATAWVPGETLDKVWPTLDTEGRTELLQQVAERLATLHRYGVFYGDLKPGNVIANDDHGAVLIDLETLREVPGVDAPVRSLEYTPGYAAPEQEALYEAYLSSDLWSFGALSGSLLTELPAAEAVRVLTRAELPEELVDKLPDPWTEVLRACLRPLPQARPRASAVAAALRGERVSLEGFMDAPPAPRFGAFVKVPAAEPTGDDSTTRVDDPTPPLGVVARVPRGPDPVTIPQPDPTDAEPHNPPSRIIQVDPKMVQQVRRDSPEPGLDDVDERTTEHDPTSASVPAVPPAARGRWLRVAMAALLLVLGAAGAQVAYGTYMEARKAQTREQANAVADVALSQLQRHKTDPEFNKQDEVLRVLEQAQQATAISRTPHALGVEALALVWSQRWHWSTATWDPEQWAIADEQTLLAIDDSPTEEGLLARGMALSAACRLMPAEGREHGRRCRAARRHLRDAIAGLSTMGDDAWLAVEAHWAAEMLESFLAINAYKGNNHGEARQSAKRALEHCEAAWPALDSAPVNGDELNEDCIGVAGWARDYEAYLRWSDRLLDRRERTGPQGARAELARIFRGGGMQCAFRDLDAQGVPTSTSRPGSWENLCDFMGLVALGCVRDARRKRTCTNRLFGQCTRWAEDPGVPWDAALLAARKPLRRVCLLD